MSFDRGRDERQRDGIFAGLGYRFKNYAHKASSLVLNKPEHSTKAESRFDP